MKDKERIQKTYLCSFCGKNQDQVQRLIAGPEMVYVCDECVARFSADTSAQSQQQRQTEQRCSFCGKQQKKVQRLVQGGGNVTICNECIELCQLILDEEPRMDRRR